MNAKTMVPLVLAVALFSMAADNGGCSVEISDATYAFIELPTPNDCVGSECAGYSSYPGCESAEGYGFCFYCEASNMCYSCPLNQLCVTDPNDCDAGRCQEPDATWACPAGYPIECGNEYSTCCPDAFPVCCADPNYCGATEDDCTHPEDMDADNHVFCEDQGGDPSECGYLQYCSNASSTICYYTFYDTSWLPCEDCDDYEACSRQAALRALSYCEM